MVRARAFFQASILVASAATLGCNLILGLEEPKDSSSTSTGTGGTTSSSTSTGTGGTTSSSTSTGTGGTTSSSTGTGGTGGAPNPCVPDPCNGHGTCDSSTGSFVCTCSQGWAEPACATCATGYAGASCSSCATGYYQFPAGTGPCVVDPCVPDPCNGHGACDNSTGSFACTCNGNYAAPTCAGCTAAYTGAGCATCATGYYEFPAGSGTCVVDPCIPDPCDGHGSCSNTTGAFACTCSGNFTGATCSSCTTGYTGAACTACATGYFEFPAGSGLCVVDPCMPNPCPGNSICNHAADTAACSCQPGWVGGGCNLCVRYVDVAATGAGTGLSWTDASTSVQPAINSAAAEIASGSTSTCDVWVAKGTYYTYAGSQSNTVTLAASVGVYGGFLGNETGRTQADPANKTTLDGYDTAAGAHAVYHVVSATAAAGAVLDGFTIVHGNANGANQNGDGGGMYVGNPGGLTVSRCEFAFNGGSGVNATTPGPITLTLTGCNIHDNTSTGFGGGATLSNGTFTVTGTTFTSNTAASDGGGLYAHNAGLSLTSSTFVGNVSGGDGGGFDYDHQFSSPMPTLSGLVFQSNQAAGHGGGFYVTAATSGFNIDDALFFGNVASLGGGAATDSVNVVYEGCTVVGNRATSSGNGLWGINVVPVVSDSIVWGNPVLGPSAQSDVIGSQTGGVNVTSSYSDIGDYGGGDPHSINQNPKFVSAPQFYDFAAGASTKTSVPVSAAITALYTVGLVIEIGGDGVGRAVSGVLGTNVSFSPPLPAAVPAGTAIVAWGAAVGMISYQLGAGSPCLGAADAVNSLPTNLLGAARGATPNMGAY